MSALQRKRRARRSGKQLAMYSPLYLLNGDPWATAEPSPVLIVDERYHQVIKDLQRFGQHMQNVHSKSQL